MTEEAKTDLEYLRQATVGKPTVLTHPIEIRDYDPQWPHIYERLAEKIRTALGDFVRDIAHTGSTSVPGLAAKPIIDIDLTVADPGREDSYIPPLEKLGYFLRIREPQWHQHRLLKLDRPQVHLHVFGTDAEPAIRNTVFRDWLRSHPKDRDLYADTKRALAQRKWTYMQEYADAKTPVVAQILANAGYEYPQESTTLSGCWGAATLPVHAESIYDLSMEWQDFQSRLDSALRSLASVPEDRILIIMDSVEPSSYVQFLTGNEYVHAEVASSKKYLPKERRLSKETFAMLQNAGWRFSRTIDNLYSEEKVTEPTLRAAIVTRCVIGLRDAHKVDSPARLQYECFTQIDGLSITVPELGLPGHNP